MAGKNQQVPRAVPSTLLEVHFVQRGGKLYKVLLPTSLKNKSSTTQLPTTPIVFEARNVKSTKHVQKSKESSPFLKPITLTPAEYKAIPLFKRGERIVDANWLPEETDCITDLLKNHKAFQDGNVDSSENMLPKIVSVTSNDIIVLSEESLKSQNDSSLMNEKPSNKVSSSSPSPNDVSQMTKEQMNSAPTFINNNKKEISVRNLETVTSISEVKAESTPPSEVKSSCYVASKSAPSSLDREKYINANVKPRMNSILKKRSMRISNLHTNSLTASSETDLPPTGKVATSLKENTNTDTTKIPSEDNNVDKVEDAKAVPPKESTASSSGEEVTVFLSLEKQKNEMTVKIQPHSSNSVLKEQTTPAMQETLEEISIKEFKPQTEVSVASASLTDVGNRKLHIDSSNSSSQNKGCLQQIVENNTNACSVTAALALMDHDYASSYPYFVNCSRRRTVRNYELRVTPKPKSHPDAYDDIDFSKAAKNTYAKARSRKPSVTLKGLAQTRISIDKSKAPPVTTNGVLPMQCQKFIGGRLPQSLPTTSIAGKQNSPGVVKSIIKLLMPRSFSNTCSEKDTVQALSRIEKLNAVTNGVVPTSATSTNINALSLKYNNDCSKPSVSSNASAVFDTTNSSVNRAFKAAESELSTTDEEFNMLEPEVIIFESKDTFIIEDGKLKLCPSKKPIRKKKNSLKHRRKANANHVCSKLPNEEKPVTEDTQSIETAKEEKTSSSTIDNEITTPSLKRTADNVDSIQNTKYQRETLLPPAPKVRKLFICRSEKAASSLLQSCFVWLDKMDERYLGDGGLDTTEIPEDILFGIRDTSHCYNKSHRAPNRYVSKTAYLKNDPFVIVESPPSTSKDVKSEASEQTDSFAAKIVEERKEANDRMADVLRLLEEKRKAIEALRQKNQSLAMTVL